MKLLDVVKMETNNITVDILNAVIFCIQERVDWLEFREPKGSGIAYDEWDMKYDDMSELLDTFEECVRIAEDDDYDDGDLTEAINSAKEELYDYQINYGGLSRLKIYP